MASLRLMGQEKHPIKWHLGWELQSGLEFTMWKERKRTFQAEAHGMTTRSTLTTRNSTWGFRECGCIWSWRGGPGSTIIIVGMIPFLSRCWKRVQSKAVSMPWYDAMPEYDRQYTSAQRDVGFHLFAMYVSEYLTGMWGQKGKRKEKIPR